MQEKVAIITPNYNRSAFVKETLNSVLNIEYENWECIIVDDGSVDNSPQIIQEFVLLDSRIKFNYRNREPKGACTCRNIGLNLTNAKYVIFLDNDDIIAPFCLKQRVTEIEKYPGLDYMVFPMLLFRNEPYDHMKLWNIETEQDHLSRLLKLDPIAQGSGQIWKRESLINIGGWNENLMIWQDIDLSIRAFANDFRYKTCLDLNPDIFLRFSTDDSISRIGYFSKEKLLSRQQVLYSSIAQIEQLKIEASQLRFMAWDVICSAIKGNEIKMARNTYKLSLKNKVLTNLKRTFYFIYFVQKFKLFKIPILKRMQNTRFRLLNNSAEIGMHLYIQK